MSKAITFEFFFTTQNNSKVNGIFHFNPNPDITVKKARLSITIRSSFNKLPAFDERPRPLIIANSNGKNIFIIIKYLLNIKTIRDTR